MDDVRVGRVAGATGKLLVTSRSDNDRVLHGSLAAGVKRAHVEDVDALHLTQDLETLKTSSLLEVGRNGTGLGTRTEEVILSLDL